MVAIWSTNILQERESIICSAMSDFANELRQIDPSDFTLFLRGVDLPSIFEKVNSILAAKFTSPQVSFACTGDVIIDWESVPVVGLDFELTCDTFFAFFRLWLKNGRNAVELHHLSFQDFQESPEQNTMRLKRFLQDLKA